MFWELCICGGDPPIYRDFHSATAIGDKMFIFGGRSDISGGLPGQILGSEFYSNKVHYLDVNTLTWHTPSVSNAPSPEMLEAAAAAAAGAAVDAPSPFFKPFAPDGRRSHSALNLDGHLLIFGGYNGRQDKHYNDMWLLQTAPRFLWRKLTPKGPAGPNRRRRQAMCRVGDRVVIFGGTSPYHGPPIIFTQQQQELMPEHDPFSVKLVDHNDLYVLDLNPSLKTLCFQVVKARGLDTDELPRDLKIEYANLTRPNSITTKLPTLPLG